LIAGLAPSFAAAPGVRSDCDPHIHGGDHETELSRRATLAGALSLAPAAAAAAVPIASTTALAGVKVDPIFAAIEKHRAAFKIFTDAVKRYSQVQRAWFDQREHWEDPQPQEVTDAEADDAATGALACDALNELIETRPTSLAGKLAVIRYVTSYYNGENEFCRGRYHPLLGGTGQVITFMTTIGDAIEAVLAA
jgi:hypothetical protein